MPLTVGALFTGSSMVIAFADEEDFGVALAEDERGLTVFSQPAVQQNVSVSSM
jgi:hypothetical protein